MCAQVDRQQSRRFRRRSDYAVKKGKTWWWIDEDDFQIASDSIENTGRRFRLPIDQSKYWQERNDPGLQRVFLWLRPYSMTRSEGDARLAQFGQYQWWVLAAFHPQNNRVISFDFLA
jgi:hypothetical protein